MNDLRVREAVPDDLEKVRRLVREFWREHDRIAGQTSERDARALDDEVRELLAGPDSGYLVADDTSGRLVGFRRWVRQEGFVFTREMYVAPDLRRRGVARLLIRSFERWLLDQGQDVACISVVPGNAAMIELARSAGYDTLNMIELKKDLGPGHKERGEAEALGLRWKVSG